MTRSSRIPWVATLAICVVLLAVTFSFSPARGQVQRDLQVTAQPVHPLPANAAPKIDDKVIEREVDLNDAIHAHARDSGQPIAEAKSDAMKQLFAFPQDWDASVVKKTEVRPGVYRITAPERYHNFIDGTRGWLLSGKKQICIEARFLKVSPETRNQLHSDFVGTWSTSNQSFGDNNHSIVSKGTYIPKRGTKSPILSTGTHRRLSKTTNFIAASSQTIRAAPCRIAVLSGVDTTSLIRRQQRDSSIQLLMAPKVTVFPEHQATVEMATQRPFAVSVRPSKDDASVMEPVIEVLNDGITLNLKATFLGISPDADKTDKEGTSDFETGGSQSAKMDKSEIDLLGSVVHSEIGDVETFTFTPQDATEECTVQIPSQTIRQVDFAQQIPDGGSLLIDPQIYKDSIIERRLLPDVTKREYSLLLLTVRVILDE